MVWGKGRGGGRGVGRPLGRDAGELGSAQGVSAATLVVVVTGAS